MITMNIQNLGDDAASPSSPPACGEELKAAKQKLNLLFPETVSKDPTPAYHKIPQIPVFLSFFVFFFESQLSELSSRSGQIPTILALDRKGSLDE